MNPKNYFKKCVLICSCSSTFLLIGILLISLKSVLFKFLINQVFVLQSNDSYTYSVWKKNPVPLTLKLYLFNWTNPTDIFNSSIKPNFEEFGPYIFDETKEKSNITWNNKNNTVTFYHLKKWFFNAKMSKGSFHDPILSVNPIALSAAVTTKNWNFITRKIMNTFFKSADIKLYETHAANQILFTGYETSLLTMANLPFVPTVIPQEYDKFGWFYLRNNSRTFEGEFNMDMGVNGTLGELYKWKSMKQTDYYPGKCGKVSGSAGEFFPNNLSKETIIRLFSPDLCRYVELEFAEEVTVYGIVGYKYVADDRFLDNGTKVPDNKCFCTENCMPSGALDISTCRFGTPSYVSLPHFFKADPYYSNSIQGMKPNRTKHEFYITLEPKTGLPLQVAARLQVNLLLQPIDQISLYENVPKVIIPVLWFEQTVTFPEDMSYYLYILLNFENILLVSGLILIFATIFINSCYWYRTCNKKFIYKQSTKKTITNNNNNKKEQEVPLKAYSSQNY